MDHSDFDALTRSAMAEGGTRRALLRLLTVSALGGLIAHLGLSEAGEAQAKQTRKRRKPEAKSQPTGELHTEGKRNKRKKRDKNDKKPKDPPPPPRCSPDQWQCADGKCVAQSECCPGERQCPDGGGCISEGACCPGEKRCIDGGSCYSEDFCCPNDPEPSCSLCEEAVCDNGNRVCQFQAGAECDTGYGSVGTCCGVFRIGAMCCPEKSFCCPSFGCCAESLRGTLPNGAPCCKHPINGYCISCYP